MTWLEALRPLLPAGGLPVCVAFVGAGGKTMALFALARQAREAGASVLLTTTTALRDPRDERGRDFDSLVFLPDSRSVEGQPAPDILGRPSRPSITVVARGLRAGGKIEGPRPEDCDELKGRADFLLVEADGSRGLPIKAPAAHEPAIPACSDLVVAFVGLDALGKPANPALVHRLDAFLALTGLAEGDPIGFDALERLVEGPDGLFAKLPPKCHRVLCLGRADLAEPRVVANLEAWLPGRLRGIDLVLIAEHEELRKVGMAVASAGSGHAA